MKRIITCSDGTWNKHGVTGKDREGNRLRLETNVERIFNCIADRGADGLRQVRVYDEGVGTGTSLANKIGGGITGAGLDKNIRDVYTFICMNYQPGDQLYLFGFSRGAYTARSLAGLIYNCGILKPKNIHLVDMAFRLYRDRNKYSHPTSDMMTCFRHSYCNNLQSTEGLVPVRFIGVWDTVGALGIPLSMVRFLNRDKYKFHDQKLGPMVQYAYQALAIDEQRPLFAPTLFEWCDSVAADPDHPYRQNMEQRWFAGTHSNVGGGYPDYGLSNRALDWIMEKAAATGLGFTRAQRPWYETDPTRCREIIYNSNDLKYRLFFGSKRRKIMLAPTGENRNYVTQTIDPSVWERMAGPAMKYRPANLKGIARPSPAGLKLDPPAAGISLVEDLAAGAGGTAV